LHYLTRGIDNPTRLAPQGSHDRAGYGFERLAFEHQDMERLKARRTHGATLNDVLLGGLAVAVRRWNEGRRARGGAAYLMMPINLRPPGWRHDIVGNFASYVSVRIGRADQGSLESAIDAAAASTRRIKDGRIAGLIVDLFAAPRRLPTGVKRRMHDLIPLTANVIVDTAVLSNLGRIDRGPHFGDAGGTREIWFSPPGRMPLGASFGAATLDGRLFLTLRHRHALFDATAAAHFLATLRRVLVEDCVVNPPTPNQENQDYG
jgi:NRPS condensation-like uncharacterized protein